MGTSAKYLDGKELNGHPILNFGDINEVTGSANAFGDDNIQEKYQGRIAPDSFTHGTS